MNLKYIFLLPLIAILFCGCSSSYNGIKTLPYGTFEVGGATYLDGYKVFQTLTRNFGLARNDDFMVVAIKSSSEFAPIYDGERLSGLVVMIDTYTYETVKDEHGRSTIKTVPLVVPHKEYKTSMSAQ